MCITGQFHRTVLKYALFITLISAGIRKINSLISGSENKYNHGIMGYLWIPGSALHCYVNSPLTAHARVIKAIWKSYGYASNLIGEIYFHRHMVIIIISFIFSYSCMPLSEPFPHKSIKGHVMTLCHVRPYVRLDAYTLCLWKEVVKTRVVRLCSLSSQTYGNTFLPTYSCNLSCNVLNVCTCALFVILCRLIRPVLCFMLDVCALLRFGVFGFGFLPIR